MYRTNNEKKLLKTRLFPPLGSMGMEKVSLPSAHVKQTSRRCLSPEGTVRSKAECADRVLPKQQESESHS